MLNSLANHDILPHSGKGISLEMIQAALLTVSVGPDLAKALFEGAVQLELTDENEILDLDSLNKHNAIEHDGSLSRADFYWGDNHSFNQTNFASYLSNYGDSAIATHELAGNGRLARVDDSRQNNPTFTYGLKQQLISSAETAAFLGALGGVETAEPSLEFVRILFEQERIPYKEGWRPNDTIMSVPRFLVLLVKTIHASGEVMEGIERVTVEILRKILAPFIDDA